MKTHTINDEECTHVFHKCVQIVQYNVYNESNFLGLVHRQSCKEKHKSGKVNFPPFLVNKFETIALCFVGYPDKWKFF